MSTTGDARDVREVPQKRKKAWMTWEHWERELQQSSFFGIVKMSPKRARLVLRLFDLLGLSIIIAAGAAGWGLWVIGNPSYFPFSVLAPIVAILCAMFLLAAGVGSLARWAGLRQHWLDIVEISYGRGGALLIFAWTVPTAIVCAIAPGDCLWWLVSILYMLVCWQIFAPMHNSVRHMEESARNGIGDKVYEHGSEHAPCAWVRGQHTRAEEKSSGGAVTCGVVGV